VKPTLAAEETKVDTWHSMAQQNDLVNIKIAGKWMFIPLKMVLIGIDPYPRGKMAEWIRMAETA
jgi:hypothetical protein